MTKTLVIVGAGSGLGMGVARAFGRRGFQVGLIARSKDRLAGLVDELTANGVKAAAFPADVRDRDGLVDALARAEETLGPIDVLEYSPSVTGTITHAAETTVEAAREQYEIHVEGAITAVRHVLARGTRSVLLTTGVSSMIAAPFLANIGIAMAGLRNWAYALHAELAPRGVHVGTVTIATGIVEGDPVGDPDVVGERYCALYEQPDKTEEVVGDLEAFRALVAQRSWASEHAS